MKTSKDREYWRDQYRQIAKAVALGLAGVSVLWTCVWLAPKAWPLVISVAFEVGDWLASFTRLEWIAVVGICLVLRAMRRISRQIDGLRERPTV